MLGFILIINWHVVIDSFSKNVLYDKMCSNIIYRIRK